MNENKPVSIPLFWRKSKKIIDKSYRETAGAKQKLEKKNLLPKFSVRACVPRPKLSSIGSLFGFQFLPGWSRPTFWSSVIFYQHFLPIRLSRKIYKKNQQISPQTKEDGLNLLFITLIVFIWSIYHEVFESLKCIVFYKFCSSVSWPSLP